MSGRWLRIAPLDSSTRPRCRRCRTGRPPPPAGRGSPALPNALRHRERVVAELDAAGGFVAFVHRIVGDPAEIETPGGDQSEIPADPRARAPGQPGRALGLVAGEEHRVAVADTGPAAQRRRPVLVEEPGDRALRLAALEDDVAQPAGALLARPVVEPVEEAARLGSGAGRGDRPHHRPGLDRAGENLQRRAAPDFGGVGDFQRVAQVRLVGAVAQHGIGEGDAPERRGRDRPARGKLLEEAAEHRLDGGEHVVLGDEGHLEIELVELARRAVRARVLVPEARRDLKIAVEARDHDELLELLRRLGQGVELAGVKPARHQEVARALRAGRGQDRRLELGEAGFDHPAPDRLDHRATQHDVALHLLPTQVRNRYLSRTSSP